LVPGKQWRRYGWDGFHHFLDVDHTPVFLGVPTAPILPIFPVTLKASLKRIASGLAHYGWGCLRNYYNQIQTLIKMLNTMIVPDGIFGLFLHH